MKLVLLTAISVETLLQTVLNLEIDVAQITKQKSKDAQDDEFCLQAD